MEIEKAAAMLNVPGEIEPIANLKKILKDKNAYVILKSLCGTEYKPSVRRWALEGFATFSKPEVSKILKKSLTDEFMTIRLHAMRAIYTRNKDSEIKALIPLLNDESGGIRLNALEILGNQKYKGLSEKIETMLTDEKNYIRKKAKEILSTEWGKK